jgi:Ca-activated chloride channel family protein
MANLGQKVSLGVEPQSGASVAEVLNDLDRNALGRLMLANLVVGMPISVVVRLKLPPIPRSAEVCRFRLAWDEPNGGPRRSIYASLTLDSRPSEAWEELPNDSDVAEQVAFLMAARARREAIVAYDRGDMVETMGMVDVAMACLRALPESTTVARERDEIDQIRAALERGEGAKFRKGAHYQAYRKKQGRDS